MILAIIAIGRQILMITMICTIYAIYAYMCMSMAEWMCARRPSNGHFSWEFVPSCGGKQALTKSSWQNSGILWWSLSGSGHFALQAVLHPDAGSLKHPQPIGRLADRDRFRQASLCESLVFRHVFVQFAYEAASSPRPNASREESGLIHLLRRTDSREHTRHLDGSWRNIWQGSAENQVREFAQCPSMSHSQDPIDFIMDFMDHWFAKQQETL